MAPDAIAGPSEMPFAQFRHGHSFRLANRPGRFHRRPPEAAEMPSCLRQAMLFVGNVHASHGASSNSAFLALPPPQRGVSADLLARPASNPSQALASRMQHIGVSRGRTDAASSPFDASGRLLRADRKRVCNSLAAILPRSARDWRRLVMSADDRPGAISCPGLRHNARKNIGAMLAGLAAPFGSVEPSPR